MSDFDRDAAREVLLNETTVSADWAERILDMLEVCVRPASPQGLDRATLVSLIEQSFWEDEVERETAQRLADRILALVRPGDGVVLTREEALYARRWLPTQNSPRARALAARLEAAL